MCEILENICCPNCGSERLSIHEYARPYPEVGNRSYTAIECNLCGLVGYSKKDIEEAFDNMVANIPLHKISLALNNIVSIMKHRE